MPKQSKKVNDGDELEKSIVVEIADAEVESLKKDMKTYNVTGEQRTIIKEIFEEVGIPQPKTLLSQIVEFSKTMASTMAKKIKTRMKVLLLSIKLIMTSESVNTLSNKMSMFSNWIKKMKEKGINTMAQIQSGITTIFNKIYNFIWKRIIKFAFIGIASTVVAFVRMCRMEKPVPVLEAAFAIVDKFKSFIDFILSPVNALIPSMKLQFMEILSSIQPEIAFGIKSQLSKLMNSCKQVKADDTNANPVPNLDHPKVGTDEKVEKIVDQYRNSQKQEEMSLISLDLNIKNRTNLNFKFFEPELEQKLKELEQQEATDFCEVQKMKKYCDGNLGIVRSSMPQLIIVKNEDGTEIDILKQFLNVAKQNGIEIEVAVIPLDRVLASQNEMLRKKVVGLAKAILNQKVSINEPEIVVTQADSTAPYYVLDGHHRTFASKIINYEKIRAIVMRNFDIKDALRLAFDKNVMGVEVPRKDLNGQSIKYSAVFDWPEEMVSAKAEADAKFVFEAEVRKNTLDILREEMKQVNQRLENDKLTLEDLAQLSNKIKTEKGQMENKLNRDAPMTPNEKQGKLDDQFRYGPFGRAYPPGYTGPMAK